MIDKHQRKRSIPKRVPSLTYKGIRYEAEVKINLGDTEVINSGTSHVCAYDTNTNELIWNKPAYKVRIDPNKELDTQDCFITALTIQDNKLAVTNESGEVYLLDTNSGEMI